MRRGPQEIKKAVAKAIKTIFLRESILGIGGMFFIWGFQLMNTV